MSGYHPESAPSSTRIPRVSLWSRKEGSTSPSSPDVGIFMHSSKPDSGLISDVSSFSPTVDRNDRKLGPSPKKQQQHGLLIPQQQASQSIPLHNQDLPRPHSASGERGERDKAGDKQDGRRRGGLARAVPAPLVLPFANRLTTMATSSASLLSSSFASAAPSSSIAPSSIFSSPSSASSPSSNASYTSARPPPSPDSDAPRSRDGRPASFSYSSSVVTSAGEDNGKVGGAQAGDLVANSVTSSMTNLAIGGVVREGDRRVAGSAVSCGGGGGGGSSMDSMSLTSRAVMQLREPDRRYSPPSSQSGQMLPLSHDGPQPQLSPRSSHLSSYIDNANLSPHLSLSLKGTAETAAVQLNAREGGAAMPSSFYARRASVPSDLSPSSADDVSSGRASATSFSRHHLPAPPGRGANPSSSSSLMVASASLTARTADSGGLSTTEGLSASGRSEEGGSIARPSVSRLRGAAAQPMMLPPPPLAMTSREAQALPLPPPVIQADSQQQQQASGRTTGRAQAVQLPQPPQQSALSSQSAGTNAVLAASLSLGMAPGPAASMSSSTLNLPASAAHTSMSPVRHSARTSPPTMSPRGHQQQPHHLQHHQQQYRACPVRWGKGQELGRGSYGTVYEGLNEDDGSFFAVKEIVLDGDPAAAQEIEHEVAMMRQLQHPNIVQYLGTCQRHGALYIFLELGKASLHSVLKKYQQFGESLVRTYTRQILHGLHYLHQQNVMHRDIKCANVLVFDRGQVKLADFGMAKSLDRSDMAKSTKGSPYWMAPEVLGARSGGYGLSADIWSLGCTVLEMAEGRPPWSNIDGFGFIFRLKNGDSPPIPEHLSPEARDFVRLCLQHDPALRPSAGDLLMHPFVCTGGEGGGSSTGTGVASHAPASSEEQGVAGLAGEAGAGGGMGSAGSSPGSYTGSMRRAAGPMGQDGNNSVSQMGGAPPQYYVQAFQRQQQQQQPGNRLGSQLSPSSLAVSSSVFQLPTVVEGLSIDSSSSSRQGPRSTNELTRGHEGKSHLDVAASRHTSSSHQDLSSGTLGSPFRGAQLQPQPTLQRPGSSPPYHARLPSPVSSEFPVRVQPVATAPSHSPSQPHIPLMAPPGVPMAAAASGGAGAVVGSYNAALQFPRSASALDPGKKPVAVSSQMRRHTEPADWLMVTEGSLEAGTQGGRSEETSVGAGRAGNWNGRGAEGGAADVSRGGYTRRLPSSTSTGAPPEQAPADNGVALYPSVAVKLTK